MARGKSHLPDEIKRFIVGELACFATPSEVVTFVKDAFDIDVTRQQVQGYDPTTSTGQSLSDKWRELFRATREECRSQVMEVPIASRVVRLKFLDRAFRRLERRGNILGAAAIIEQASREVGGMNERRPLGHYGRWGVTRSPPSPAPTKEAVAKADAMLREFLRAGKVRPRS